MPRTERHLDAHPGGCTSLQGGRKTVDEGTPERQRKGNLDKLFVQGITLKTLSCSRTRCATLIPISSPFLASPTGLRSTWMAVTFS